MKTCIKCKEIKALTEYYKSKSAKSGYNNVCKVCKKKDALCRHYENIELRKKQQVEWYYNNQEHVQEYRIKQRESGYYRTDEAKARGKKWKEENPEKVLASIERHLKKFKNYTRRNVGYALQSWSTSVKQRDDYTCQHCHTDLLFEESKAHHIVAKSNFPQYAFDLDNGITLCHTCHMIEHHAKPTLGAK